MFSEVWRRYTYFYFPVEQEVAEYLQEVAEYL